MSMMSPLNLVDFGWARSMENKKKIVLKKFDYRDSLSWQFLTSRAMRFSPPQQYCSWKIGAVIFHDKIDTTFTLENPIMFAVGKVRKTQITWKVCHSYPQTWKWVG